MRVGIALNKSQNSPTQAKNTHKQPAAHLPANCTHHTRASWARLPLSPPTPMMQ